MVGIIIHGGAGTITGKERRALSAQGTDQAAEVGFSILEQGGTAVEAVKQAVMIMEDLPQFNAGYGSVITEEKTIEMDAMLCDGYTGNMGGLISVSRLKNPIAVCEAVMNQSKHLLFAGQGAEKFAQQHGYELIDPQELVTPRVLERYDNWKKKQELDRTDPEGREKYGTVGAVAIDNNGRLAAATSTGGVLGKSVGRVGDTPIFGAGTYADTKLAVSGTGVGEYIIQGMAALRIRNLLDSYDLDTATTMALDQIQQQFGPLGVICIDADGNWSADKTTKDLAYSYKTETEEGNFLP